jgi:hypothetical protein
MEVWLGMHRCCLADQLAGASQVPGVRHPHNCDSFVCVSPWEGLAVVATSLPGWRVKAMDQDIYARCRQAFIRRMLRAAKQHRLDEDAELRMQSSVRCGKLYAILNTQERAFTVWREGRRGLLVQISRERFFKLSDAVGYMQQMQHRSVCNVD